MVAVKLTGFEDVRRARVWVDDLARAAGIADPGAVAQAAAELGNNCVEHGNAGAGLLWIACRPGRLSLRFENRCDRRPAWCTQKPVAVDGFRTGGYGLQIARAFARSVNYRWTDGRVVVWAEFR